MNYGKLLLKTTKITKMKKTWKNNPEKYSSVIFRKNKC